MSKIDITPDTILGNIKYLNDIPYFFHLDRSIITPLSPLKDYCYFPTDIVEYQTDTNIKLVHRDKIILVGILCLENKVKYGFNKRKLPYFKFIPFSSSFPSFLVPSKIRTKGIFQNQLVIVEFTTWNEKEKWPYGKINQILGPLRDLHPQIESFYHHYSSLKKWKLSPDEEKKIIEFDLINQAIKDGHTDRRDLKIYSIDPPDCEDIDDALSIQHNNDIYTIGIHIANVTYGLQKYNLLSQLQDRYFSVYLLQKKINMLPDILADNLLSLIPNKDRLAYTLWITINSSGKMIIPPKLEETIIRNNFAWSYQKAEKSLDPYLQDLKKGALLLNKYVLHRDKHDMDIHQVIETYMIVANYLVGNIPTKNHKIYRVLHSTTTLSPIIPIIPYLGLPSAEYQLKTSNTFHSALGVDHYCHFTSPLRRWVDIYHHLILRNQTCELSIDKIKIINKNHHQLRKMSQAINKVKLSLDIQKKPLFTIAYVMDWKTSGIGVKSKIKFNLYLANEKMFISHTQYYDVEMVSQDNIKFITSDGKIEIKQYFSYPVKLQYLFNAFQTPDKHIFVSWLINK